LFGADFWQSKPWTDWSDKDVQKMMTNSPWARPFAVTTSAPAPPALGGGGGARGGGGGGRGGGGGGDDSAPAPISEKGGGGGGGGAMGGSAEVVARWQSALPMKQAFVRTKYGAKASESDDAKALIAREEPGYLIIVSGSARIFGRVNAEALKKALPDVTVLSSKAKGVLKPSDVQFGMGRGTIDLMFTFPKSAAYSLDDKEVDFSTKVGDLDLKYKFHLKDMMFNGKLEL
jgi:hypothetical protein